MILIKEVWKNIVGYEDRYMVSNLGRVKSVINGKDKILQLQKDNNYFFVCLRKDGNAKFFRVHRLVASAFVDNPNNYPVVNHINWDKHDNRAENLEWCTYSYNNWYIQNRTTDYNDVILRKDRRNQEKRKSRRHSSFKRHVLCVETGITYDSISCAARACGVEQSNVSRALTGRQKTSGGFHWKYVDNCSYNVREYFRMDTEKDADLIKILSKYNCDPDTKERYIKDLIRAGIKATESPRSLEDTISI